MAWAAGNCRVWLVGGLLNSTMMEMALTEGTVHGKSKYRQYAVIELVLIDRTTGRQMLQAISSSRTFDRSLPMRIQ